MYMCACVRFRTSDAETRSHMRGRKRGFARLCSRTRDARVVVSAPSSFREEIDSARNATGGSSGSGASRATTRKKPGSADRAYLYPDIIRATHSQRPEYIRRVM